MFVFQLEHQGICLFCWLSSASLVGITAKLWPHCTCSVSDYPCLDTKDNNFITWCWQLPPPPAFRVCSNKPSLAPVFQVSWDTTDPNSLLLIICHVQMSQCCPRFLCVFLQRISGCILYICGSCRTYELVCVLERQGKKGTPLCPSTLPNCYLPLLCRCHGYSALSLPSLLSVGGYGGMGLERRGEKWLWLLPLRHIHTSAAESPPTTTTITPPSSHFPSSTASRLLPSFPPSFLPSHHPICTLLDPPPPQPICVSYLHLLITFFLPHSLCWPSLVSSAWLAWADFFARVW